MLKMVKQEIYDKWIKKYGYDAKQALDMIEGAKGFGKELGRIFLPNIVNHINKGTCIYISDSDWLVYTINKKINKVKLNIIISKNRKGSVLLKQLEDISIKNNIPIITLKVVSDIPAVQWYYKKGFKCVSEDRSKKGTKLLVLEKQLFKYGLERFGI